MVTGGVAARAGAAGAWITQGAVPGTGSVDAAGGWALATVVRPARTAAITATDRMCIKAPWMTSAARFRRMSFKGAVRQSVTRCAAGSAHGNRTPIGP